jgi:hypothetical protein
MNTQLCQITALKMQAKTSPQLSVKENESNTMTGLLRAPIKSRIGISIPPAFFTSSTNDDVFEQIIR